MPPTSPEHASARPPHPLAAQLIAALGSRSARVIDFATGSGRNATALRQAGHEVLAIDDVVAAGPKALLMVTEPYQAVISTHGLLHGTPATVYARLTSIAASMEPGGLLYATFGSTADARHGQGREIEPFVHAPAEGDERGVPHVFYDETRLRTALGVCFDVESLEEHGVDDVAGSWAHSEKPLERSVHWFAKARKCK
jgi:hypothetical protein